MTPSSVLDIGGARGYLAKKLIANGIPAMVMDKSLHCYHTRVTEDFVLHDILDIPWPFENKQFDLVCSFSVLDELPKDKLPAINKEIERISYRSFNIRSELEHIGFFIPSGTGLKLNFGCFINMFYFDWLNIDILDLSQFAAWNKYKFHQMALPGKLPVADNSTDLIFSSHFLEHLTRDEALVHLTECHRIMKPGAVMRTAVPDAQLLIRKYRDDTIHDFDHVSQGCEDAKTPLAAMWEVLLGGDHKMIYDFETMKELMLKAGFTDIKRSDPFHSQNKRMENETFVSHPSLSLCVEAIK
jgi:predicted SAM-dependent methyltransferase